MILELLLPLMVSAAPTCMDTSETIDLGTSSYANVSPDGEYAFITNTSDQSMEIKNLKTGVSKKVSKTASEFPMIIGNQMVLMDSSALSSGNLWKDLKLKVVDNKTGALTELKNRWPLANQMVEVISTTADSLTVKTSNGKTYTTPIGTGVTAKSTLTTFGEDPKKSVAIFDRANGKIKVENDDGAAEINIPNFKSEDPFSSGEITPDGKYYIYRMGAASSSYGTTANLKPPKALVVNIAEKTSKTIDLPPDVNLSYLAKKSYNPKTGDMLFSSPYGGNSPNLTKSLNLKTGKVESVAKIGAGKSIANLFFNAKGQVCGIKDGMMKVCTEVGSEFPDTGLQIADTVSTISPATDDIFTVSSYGNGVFGNMLFVASQDCNAKTYSVSCNCDVEKPTDATSNIDDLKSVVLAAACSADYKQKDWEKLTNPDVTNLSEGQAVTWLKRFSKPNGYDDQKDLSVLNGIMESKIQNSYPGLVKAVLRNLMVTSPRTFTRVSKKYPKYLETSSPSDFSCLSDKEKQKLQTDTFQFLRQEMLKKVGFEKMARVARFGSEGLSDIQKEQIAETASDNITEVATTVHETQGVFSSKIHKFSLYQFEKMMGKDSPNITDFTVVRRGSELYVKQLGRDSFEGAKQTATGIWIKDLGTITTDGMKSDSRSDSYKWKYDGKDFKGDLIIEKTDFDAAALLPPNKSPDYKDMWKDKEFRGVVMAGTNLGSSTTQQVMNEYVEYYTQQGFTFDKPVENKDMMGYLKDKVSGKGQMDYFIKEAHSGGDEKTMFDIGKEGFVLTGTKKVGDRREVVELVYPNSSKIVPVPIDNSEFGQWARDREKNGGSELMYLNTSCWSVGKAVYEIPAARTKKLVNIPTATSVSVFVNSPYNIMKNLVDGIRQEKDYEGIRTLLKNNPGYAEGKSNVILFPDEQKYHQQVVENVKAPFELTSKVSVKNSSGQYENYNIGVH